MKKITTKKAKQQLFVQQCENHLSDLLQITGEYLADEAEEINEASKNGYAAEQRKNILGADQAAVNLMFWLCRLTEAIKITHKRPVKP